MTGEGRGARNKKKGKGEVVKEGIEGGRAKTGKGRRGERRKKSGQKVYVGGTRGRSMQDE